MKKSFSFLTGFAVLLMLTFSACKKNDVDDSNNITDDQVKTQSEDQARFSTEDDALTDELRLYLESESSLHGRGQGAICGATINLNTSVSPRIATITFNGDTCTGRVRTGVVVLSLTGKWGDAGTQLSISYQNVKITRLIDGKSIVINGTKIITNQTGHFLLYLMTHPSDSIVHTIKSTNMSVTFDNGTARTWQIETKRVFLNNTGLVVKTYGTYNDGTNSDVAWWGTNRFGQTFSTRIIAPIVVRQACNFRVAAGKVVHTKLAKDITVTFGLNGQGNPQPDCGMPLFMKIDWTRVNGNPGSILLQY